MRLSRVFAHRLPPRISEEIQAWMVLAGIVGMIVAPFLATRTAIIVINEVSMLTLTISGLSGVDAARTGGNDGGN